jgi:sirohydrochlorin cobaltochelatase
VNNDLTDAALVLVGHGSTKNADSSAPVYQHAAELRRRQVFADVLECFWKVEPGLSGVLQRVLARRVFIVPLFISEGYFTEQAIPCELGLRAKGQTDFARVQQRGNQTLFYCAPVGTHDSMTGVLLARARDVVQQYPFPHAPKPGEIAFFIAGHGTDQNENSRKAIERHVELIRQRHEYAEVHPAFIEEEPRIGDCYRLAQARNIVIVPFFISDGMHSVEDIPVLLGEPERLVRERLQNGQPTWRNPTERNGKRLWYSTSIGTEPHVTDVILERVRERESEEINPLAPNGGVQ